MHLGIVLLRIVHILFGVFWAGTMFFFVLWLEPSLRAVGPAGGQVMGQLGKRGYLTWMPVIAGLAVLSGLWLYWLDFGRGGPTMMASRFAMTLGTGAVLAIIALVLGIAIMRPTALRLLALGAAATQASDAGDRERLMGEMNPLRDRLRDVGRWIAGLLTGAVLTMAMARYF
jgi:uncharacterized membrane protein